MKKILLLFVGLLIGSSIISMEPPVKKRKLNVIFSRNQFLGIPDLPQDCIDRIAEMVALNAGSGEYFSDDRFSKNLKTLGKYILATSKSKSEFHDKYSTLLSTIIDSKVKKGIAPLVALSSYIRYFNSPLLRERLSSSNLIRLSMLGLIKFLQNPTRKVLYPKLLFRMENFGLDYYTLYADIYKYGSDKDLFIESSDINSLKGLLEHGISIGTIDHIKAIEKNNIDILDLLLKYSGFNQSRLELYINYTPLEKALSVGNQKMVEMLKAFALSTFAPLATVEEVIRYRMDRFNQHPFDIALDLYPILGPEVLTVLKDMNAYDGLYDEMKVALEDHNIEEARVIWQKLYTSLSNALTNQNLNEVERILKLGFIQPNSLLIENSMKSGNVELIKILRDNVRDHKDLLKNALESGKAEVLRVILQLPNILSLYSEFESEKQPLHYAIESHHEAKGELLQALLESGADLDEAFPNGTVINHLFRKLNEKDLKKILPLVKNNILNNLNNQDNNGNTLLMNLVSQTRSMWKIKLLIKLGANLAIRNKKNQSALTVAREYMNNDKIIDLLIKAGAPE